MMATTFLRVLTDHVKANELDNKNCSPNEKGIK